jgi:hypothetical protein
VTVPQTEPPPEPVLPDPSASTSEPVERAPRHDDSEDRVLSDDELVDEQGEESFPASDPPAH